MVFLKFFTSASLSQPKECIQVCFEQEYNLFYTKEVADSYIGYAIIPSLKPKNIIVPSYPRRERSTTT